MYSEILFDLDGTLSDSEEGITKSVQFALQKQGIEERDHARLMQFFGPPLRDQFMAGYGFDDEKARRALADYRTRYSTVGWRENRLYDGIPSLLDALVKAGKRLAVASSKPEAYCEKIIRYFEIDQYFEVIAGATMDGRISAKSDVLTLALGRLGVTPDMAGNRAVLVGDRRYDVEGARAQGMDCIGVAFGYGTREELETAGAAAVVGSVEELRQLLLSGRGTRDAAQI